MKTTGGDAFITYHMLYHYTKISKNRQNYKMDDIIPDACMKFEKYSIKTVGQDAFCSYYISNNYFKISKFASYSKIV